MLLFFEKTIRHYVHIIYPQIFNWRNLPTLTSMSLSVSVSMDTDTDRDMHVNVDMGRSRCFSTFFPFNIFCHQAACFSPFDVLSRSAFFPFGFLSFDVLSFDVLYFRCLLLRHFVGEPLSSLLLIYNETMLYNNTISKKFPFYVITF
jgi:hypothetical protein